MNESILALMSICVGIFGALGLSLYNKKYSFGLIGNIIVGVFGSVFFTKLIGRFGISPMTIINITEVNYNYLFIYFIIAFGGGVVSLWLSKKILTKTEGTEI